MDSHSSMTASFECRFLNKHGLLVNLLTTMLIERHQATEAMHG